MARNFTGVATNCLAMTGSPAALNIANNAPVAVACWVNFNSFAASATLLGKGYDGAHTAYTFQPDRPGYLERFWRRSFLQI
jgi:hypothetical protein